MNTVHTTPTTAAETCPTLNNDNHANWQSSVPPISVQGQCVPGWGGFTERECTDDGWQPPTSLCQRMWHMLTAIHDAVMPSK